MPKLRACVHVRDSSGKEYMFLPENEVPDWAAKLITNPKAWADYEPPTKSTPAPVVAPVVSETAKVMPDDTFEASDAPPRGGPGSGRSVWQEFAEAHEVEIPNSASKADIIAACEAAGII